MSGINLTVCGYSTTQIYRGTNVNLSDSYASRIKNPESMITSHAYLLFYRRRSDRALGGPRFENILRRFESGDEDDDDDAAINSQGSESR